MRVPSSQSDSTKQRNNPRRRAYSKNGMALIPTMRSPFSIEVYEKSSGANCVCYQCTPLYTYVNRFNSLAAVITGIAGTPGSPAQC